MFYPDAPCCPKEKTEQPAENAVAYNCCEAELLKKIAEINFAITDLNLFLDTHPSNSEALELFKQLSATYGSLVFDYEKKFGPLTARSSNNPNYFSWVSDEYKWPWQKGCEA